jgi:hypothetical protein
MEAVKNYQYNKGECSEKCSEKYLCSKNGFSKNGCSKKHEYSKNEIRGKYQ